MKSYYVKQPRGCAAPLPVSIVTATRTARFLRPGPGHRRRPVIMGASTKGEEG
jgi:hypothetical protein